MVIRYTADTKQSRRKFKLTALGEQLAHGLERRVVSEQTTTRSWFECFMFGTSISNLKLSIFMFIVLRRSLERIIFHIVSVTTERNQVKSCDVW